VNVQLPQKFNAAALRVAHERAREEGQTFTEDASLFYRYDGGRVRILAGSERNLKITLPTDLIIAEAIHADAMGRSNESVGRD
jgi:2-C-methyl-D-erythritol 4-phosphate cytidylyltransferase